MRKLNIPEDQLEIFRYRNMLFRLYDEFVIYRDKLKDKGISDPEGWEMDEDLEKAIRLEQRYVDEYISVRAINVLRSLDCHTFMDVVKLSEKSLRILPPAERKQLMRLKNYWVNTDCILVWMSQSTNG